MKYDQRIYYSITGFTLLLGWLVAAAVVILNNIPVTETNKFHEIATSFYLYFINWKVYALISIIFGVKAAIMNDQRSLGVSVFECLGYVIVAIGLSFVNAITLAFIPIALGYLILHFFKNQSRLHISISVMFFVLVATFLTLFTKGNNFLMLAFSDLIHTKLTVVHFESTLALLFKPDQLFGFSFALAMLFVGYWIGRARWFAEYHFLYRELKHLFKLSIALLIFWMGLNYFHVYNFIANWKIGKLFFVLDGFAVQVITLYLYSFVLISFENYSWGLKILKFLEHAGKGWVYQIGFLCLFWIIFTNNVFALPFFVIPIAGVTFFAIIAFLIKMNSSINKV